MVGTLLQQVRMVDPVSQTDKVVDIWLNRGVVAAISPSLTIPSGTTLMDGTGKVLFPGLVDLYSQSAEPGHEARETLVNFSQAAIAGGFTRVGVLPTTDPPLDNSSALGHVLDLAQKLPAPRPTLLPWAALTDGARGEQMTELATLAHTHPRPFAGFADGQPLQNLVLLRRLLEYARSLSCPIALWPCDLALAGNGVAREGPLALRGGLPGIPVTAETGALAMILELVREIKTPVHLMRISTARSVELIARAKQAGLPITASTTWLHLLFSTADTLRYDPNLRLNPPLGNPEDVASLAAGIKSGVIDAIAVDHTPYTYEEKTVAFGDAPPGAIGLSTAFSALWQRFVATQEWSALDLLQALVVRPARCLGITPPQIAVGQPIEACLFDPQKTWTVTAATLRSPACNSPLLHQTLTGQMLHVWC